MRMLGRLREDAKAPQASQARPAPHCVGRIFARASPAWEPPLSGEVTSEAKSEGPCPFAVVHTAQFFSVIFGWLYSIFYKHEQNMSLPS